MLIKHYCVVRVRRINYSWNLKDRTKTSPLPPRREVMQIASFQSGSLCVWIDWGVMGWQLSIHFIRLPTSVILPTPHSYFSRATHSYTYTTQWREISLHRQFLSLSSSSPSPIEPRDSQEFSGQHDQTRTIRGSGHVYQFKKKRTRTPVSVIT